MSAPAIHTSRIAALRLPGGSPKVNFYAAGLLVLYENVTP
jgi:hypothetical protein